MQIFEKEITVSKKHLDQLNHVNNVQYVQWVQDIAEAHWLKNATNALLESYYWFMIKHTIDYKGQAFLGDVISIKTFIQQSEGVTSVRKVEMHNQYEVRMLTMKVLPRILLRNYHREFYR